MNYNKVFGLIVNNILLLFLLSFSLSLVFSVVELYTYPGFTASHLIISLNTLILSTILIGALSGILKTDNKNTTLKRFYLKLINKGYLFLILTLVVSIILLLVESYKYPNYIFSKYHIHPASLLPFSTLFFITLLLKLISVFEKGVNSKLKIVLSFTLITIMFSWFTKNIFENFNNIIYQSKPMIKTPFSDYDSKMRNKWGKFYDCMLLIQNNTPRDAIIAIPPHTSPWELEGNDYLVRYFLHPRKVFSTFIGNPNTINDAQYLFFSWGFFDNKARRGGWPDFKVEGKSIIYLEGMNFIAYESGSYNPMTMDKIKTCGIIKLR